MLLLVVDTEEVVETLLDPDDDEELDLLLLVVDIELEFPKVPF